MKLEKALEILEFNVKEDRGKMPTDCKDALNLGIEGLKRLAHHRRIDNHEDQELLPGETEE